MFSQSAVAAAIRVAVASRQGLRIGSMPAGRRPRVLCDTGPLVAAFDKADDDHERDVRVIEATSPAGRQRQVDCCEARKCVAAADGNRGGNDGNHGQPPPRLPRSRGSSRVGR
jgi:hypothetical protein